MSIPLLVPENKIRSMLTGSQQKLTGSQQKALESLAKKLREKFSDITYVGTPDYTKYLDEISQYISEHSDFHVTDVTQDPIKQTVHVTIEPKPMTTIIEIGPTKNDMLLLYPDERTLWGKKEDSTDNGN